MRSAVPYPGSSRSCDSRRCQHAADTEWHQRALATAALWQRCRGQWCQQCHWQCPRVRPARQLGARHERAELPHGPLHGCREACAVQFSLLIPWAIKIQNQLPGWAHDSFRMAPGWQVEELLQKTSLFGWWDLLACACARARPSQARRGAARRVTHARVRSPGCSRAQARGGWGWGGAF